MRQRAMTQARRCVGLAVRKGPAFYRLIKAPSSSQKQLSPPDTTTGTQSVYLGVGATNLRSEMRFMRRIKHPESFPDG